VLLFFLILSICVVTNQGIGWVSNWTTLAISAWMVFRARREIAGIVRTARRLDRGGKGTNPP
jgi:hypothetical protein